MLRIILAASAVTALALASTAPASAPRRVELKKYSSLYTRVAQVHGKRAPGRKITKFGVRTGHGARPATAAEVGRSIRTFRRWLAPPSPPVKAGDRISSSPAHAGGKWAIPSYIVMCESGGNYHARNPSGAGGAYQIMPSTWAANGGIGDPASAPPAEQDRIAGKIYAAQGAAPWVCG